MRQGFLIGSTTLLVLALSSQAWAPPINGISARVLFGNLTLGLPRIEWTQFNSLERDGDRVPDLLGQRVTVLVESYTQLYAPTRDLTLGLALNQVEKEFEFKEPTTGRRFTLHSSGFGDLTTSGTYRFYRKDTPEGSQQASGLLAIKAPTGSTDKASDRTLLLPGAMGDKLPLSLQPGTGSTDFIVGLSYAFLRKKYNFYGAATYKANTEAEGIRFGNTLSYDLAADYLLFEGKGERPANLIVVLELNGVNIEKSAGRNSGGDIIFISPGLQYVVAARLWIETSVQIPVVRELNGTQLVPDFSILFGLRYLF